MVYYNSRLFVRGNQVNPLGGFFIVTAYLDNNATTRPLESVVAAMEPYLRTEYANPSSLHPPGQRVRYAVECARSQVAGLIGATPGEIVLTGGGTESINLAIRGALGVGQGSQHLITSAVEHSAVHRLADQLAREGHRVDRISVDREGRLDYDELEERATVDTALISIMHANNETGVLFDVRRVCDIAARYGACVHVDAVQSVGKVPVDVDELPVHLLSFSAHKMHGPKGAGALYLRRRTRIEPLLEGGTQEHGLWPGTENVPALIGFGVAAEEAARLPAERACAIRQLRDRFEARVRSAIPIARVIGVGADRVCNTSNITFERLAADAILILLAERGVYASAGAACSSGSLEPSHVLRAMGIEPELAHGAIRFSLSRLTSADEIDAAVDALSDVIPRVRATLA
jgi:cysteine desulfurase